MLFDAKNLKDLRSFEERLSSRKRGSHHVGVMLGGVLNVKETVAD